MSTLRCTNLQDTSGGNSLTTAQIYNGAAKAWVNFNGTGTVAIRASFNVSSITDGGTGIYTTNFTTAFSDANYTAVGTVSQIGSSGECVLSGHDTAPATTAFAMRVTNSANQSYQDKTYVWVSIFR